MGEAFNKAYDDKEEEFRIGHEEVFWQRVFICEIINILQLRMKKG